ncbi:unnamed protein product [Didymodactylos carnosus]|uniref:USP domain-containing protein n=1 Tax=Didymodactylos carnosus TaxID=1234261 RepID=A0A8S2EWE3_9BILA|nr:unnamed protein product [Didymodactylos carnosus]CAF4092286.1 unnamed protein product [Didymodactylos carnosus]
MMTEPIPLKNMTIIPKQTVCSSSPVIIPSLCSNTDNNNTIKNSVSDVKKTPSYSTFPLMKTQLKVPIRGNTGLYNLGNTCYVNCILQLLR